MIIVLYMFYSHRSIAHLLVLLDTHVHDHHNQRSGHHCKYSISTEYECTLGIFIVQNMIRLYACTMLGVRGRQRSVL
jgi:hypothetical protein